jgi:hypothetical protein
MVNKVAFSDFALVNQFWKPVKSSELLMALLVIMRGKFLVKDQVYNLKFVELRAGQYLF